MFDLTSLAWFVIAVLIVFGFGIVVFVVSWFRKVEQGFAVVVTGMRGTRVSFSGTVVIPVIERAELMDISLKRIEIHRHGSIGLICKDNMRADIKVAFFVRVNKTEDDVLRVAQSLGCSRASDNAALIELFDAKFSEALKTVGRHFDFVELYNSRDQFKDAILKAIGTDLNGFVLDDAAIDYLEQTKIEDLDPDNILDSAGIKKISDLTAKEKILANQINRDRERTITKQDVEAREAVLELLRQQAGAEAKQQREVAEFQAIESAQAAKTQHEQRLKSEQARISAEEEIAIAEENKNRQVIVAKKNRDRTEAVETERVEKDRALEATERERIVALAQIEKQKAVEVEQKSMQDVIRDRVMVEKTVVAEREKIKDTEAFAGADREKKVAVTRAETQAEEELVRSIKAAEAAKKAAELKADQEMLTTLKAAEAEQKAAELLAKRKLIEAQAEHEAAVELSKGKKELATGVTAEQAAAGLAEAHVLEARAHALEKQGLAEAKVQTEKFRAEADGITQKAEAMKLLDGVGREHEEFKLRLQRDLEVALAEIKTHAEIAVSQAQVLAESLKNAKVDIVGGDGQFFSSLVGAITGGKATDRLVGNSHVLTDIKESFFNGDPEYFQRQFRDYVDRFGLTSEDLKNLTIAGAISQMMTAAPDGETKGVLNRLLTGVQRLGLAQKPAREN